MKLFTKYGGLAFWTDCMERFTAKAAVHPSLQEFFLRADSSRIKEMEIALLDVTVGGGETEANVVSRTHCNLGITEAAFEGFLRLYEETLLELSVDSADNAYLLGLLAAHKSQVVGNSVV